MSVLNWLLDGASRLSSQQWLYILIGVTILGAIFLRGYGSRSNY